MVDVSAKQISLRTAQAKAVILMKPETLKRVKEGSLPKGNLFDIARSAGFIAGKKTWELIPHCHPVNIDHIHIDFDYIPEESNEQDEHSAPSGRMLGENRKEEHIPTKNIPINEGTGIAIFAYAKSIGRTGIEMEVLTAVSIAALTIYDLLKPIDKELEIASIKLLEKTGGKSDRKRKVKSGIKTAILVCSDSTASGKRKDNSGIIIKEMLEEYKAEVVDYQIVADEPTLIQEKIKGWVADDIPFIFTTGGTGLGPRDKTVEAVSEIIEREASGITEAMRSFGMMRTPWAMHSRAIAGVIGHSLIVTLPGSSNGARESLQGILPGVFHARKMLKGGGHD